MASQIETGMGITVITAANSAKLAAVEYVRKPQDPRRYWNYQEAHWRFNGHAMGLAPSDLVVSDVPWTEGQMRQFMGKGFRGLWTRLTSKRDIPFYLPEIVSGKDGLPLLAKAYPWMGWDNEHMAGIQNVGRDNLVVLSGHLRTEAAIDAPHTKTNEDQAAGILAKLGRRGQTINTYAEAGNQIKLLTGQYPDETRTLIRVMLSRVRGQVLGADFDPDGNCRVDWILEPGRAYGHLGIRSVGV